jgi:hypothetical protein
MSVSLYRSALRVSAIVTALVLVFDGGFLSPLTRQFADTTYVYLAAAGASLSASVPENEINTLSAQIAEEQRRLAEREAALNTREIAARSYDTVDTDYSTFIISVILFLILVLLVLNFVMDWRRARTLYLHEKTV